MRRQTIVGLWTRLSIIRSVLGVLQLSLLSACGSTSFTGSGSAASQNRSAEISSGAGTKAGGGQTDGTAADQPLTGLTWFWQCDASPVTVPAAASTMSPVVVDGGSHSFAQKQLQGTPVTFAGHVCAPAAMPRDILFVIDVSGSMGGFNGNDPRVGNSCGRLAAIQAVINAIPADASAQYSVITFDGSIEKASTAFFSTSAALFSDLAGSGAIADVVCTAGSDTNYQVALTEATTVLAGGRSGATKEIYFVSDGEPTASEEGTTEATALRTQGVEIGTKLVPVTLATVMLNGDGAAVEIAMSSLDASGKPLHADVSGAGNLGGALTSLAANGIASADLKYWPIGTTKTTTVDIKSKLQGFDFTLPSITIDVDQAPNGVQVLYEYVDQHNNRYASEGELLWSSGAAASGNTKS